MLFTATLLVLASCGGEKTEHKTTADITDKVAFLDAKSALPHFPFGNHPFYFFFYAEWCPHSKAMREDIFTRPEIIEYLNENFTCIGILSDSIDQVEFLGQTYTGKELLTNFKVEDYPGHYFCSAEGKLVGATRGEFGVKSFKQLLMYYAKEYYKKMDYDSYLRTKDAMDIDTVYGEF